MFHQWSKNMFHIVSWSVIEIHLRSISCSFKPFTQFLKKLPPWKLTWHWKIPIFNRKYIFIHGGCSSQSCLFSGGIDSPNPNQQLLTRAPTPDSSKSWVRSVSRHRKPHDCMARDPYKERSGFTKKKYRSDTNYWSKHIIDIYIMCMYNIFIYIYLLCWKTVAIVNKYQTISWNPTLKNKCSLTFTVDILHVCFWTCSRPAFWITKMDPPPYCCDPTQPSCINDDPGRSIDKSGAPF